MKARKTEARTDSERAKLEKELREAIRQVDEQGLLFLLRQAQVLIHNARVDRINREAEKSKGQVTLRVLGDRADRPTVALERSDGGKTIFLTIGKVRKVLSSDEMKRIVRICYSAERKSEALRQLFTVLARERKDILADAVIGNPDNPLLEQLFTVVRETYRLEDR